MKAIPVFIAIFLCLLAAGLVGRQLFAAPDPGRRAQFSRLDWHVWRATAWLDLRLYAWRWTALRWHLMLRARFVRTARPDGTACAPAARAVPLDRRTRDDLVVIHAGGMLLPDRPRETPEPGPFRVRPYYEAFEAEKAKWLA